MDENQLLMLLIPVVVIDFSGKIAALISLARAERVRFDNKTVWAAIILLVNFFGWIGWFLAGRAD